MIKTIAAHLLQAPPLDFGHAVHNQLRHSGMSLRSKVLQRVLNKVTLIAKFALREKMIAFGTPSKTHIPNKNINLTVAHVE